VCAACFDFHIAFTFCKFVIYQFVTSQGSVLNTGKVSYLSRGWCKIYFRFYARWQRYI